MIVTACNPITPNSRETARTFLPARYSAPLDEKTLFTEDGKVQQPRVPRALLVTGLP